VLIARRDGLLHPQSTEQIAPALDALPDFSIKRTLRPSGLTVLAADAAGASDRRSPQEVGRGGAGCRLKHTARLPEFVKQSLQIPWCQSPS